MVKKTVITSSTEMKRTVEEVMLQIRQTGEADKQKEYDILMCLRELISNSLLYSGCGMTRLIYELSDESFSFSVIDEGGGFEHKNAGKCPAVESESGRGIYLVRMLATEVRYNKKGTAVYVRMDY